MAAAPRPLLQFVASAVFVLMAVTAGSVGWVTWIAHAEARQSAGDAATSFAQTVVSPLRVADLEHSTHADTRSMLDQAVVGLLEDGEAYRVKIWRVEDGGVARIVYSDLTALEGTRVPVNRYLQEALDTGEPVVVPVPADVAHENEQRPGTHALEVYLPFEDAVGTVAVAELYRTAETGLRIRELLIHTLPVAIGGPILLSVLTLPLAMRLVQTQATAEAARRASVEHALAASENERRRLAGLLHDGPVQDLAALGMMLERSGAPGAVLDGRDAAERVRAQVGRLRVLLDDLDPIEEDDGDLRRSLRTAAEAVAGDAVNVTIRGSELRELDPARRALIQRCSLELLRNALAHADPGTVDVCFMADPDRVRVLVEDDGCGFDQAETPEGHHGLHLVRAAVRDVGGTMSVASGRDGTRIVLEMPSRAAGAR
ncbi:MAG TPA: hypothetical protein PKE40_00065 [Arachnia sp.]|nr:hypothetical protein [Arachnia sp.]HMT84718.1 hypothetical protein [Arachnia sp.]